MVDRNPHPIIGRRVVSVLLPYEREDGARQIEGMVFDDGSYLDFPQPAWVMYERDGQPATLVNPLWEAARALAEHEATPKPARTRGGRYCPLYLWEQKRNLLIQAVVAIVQK